MTDAPDPTAATPWWGTYTLDEGAGGQWDIGPSTVWVHRAVRDWRVVHRASSGTTDTDPMTSQSAVTLPVPAAEMDDLLAAEDPALDTRRYGVQQTTEQVALRPALADRPVVSRPEHPLYVPPGETVTLYLSSALWVRVVLADSDRTLCELPSHRMSDTWFGPSTREGTLCYATRTAGRLRLDRLPLRLHRAVTPLRVRNRADDPLALERVQLPAPHLALFQGENDMLWTNAVSMRHTAATEGADVTVEDGPPEAAPDADRVQEPRETDQRGLFTSTFSAFGALFGP